MPDDKRIVLSDTRIIKYLAPCPNCGYEEAEYEEVIDYKHQPDYSHTLTYVCHECHTWDTWQLGPDI